MGEHLDLGCERMLYLWWSNSMVYYNIPMHLEYISENIGHLLNTVTSLSN